MKRMVTAALLVAILLLSLCACTAPDKAVFTFTAEEYMAAVTELFADQMEITWSGPEVVDGGMVAWVGHADGMSNFRIYTREGETACCAIGTEAVTPLVGEADTHVGASICFILYATRYLELGSDSAAFAQEEDSIRAAYDALSAKVFTEAYETLFINRIYGKEAVIAGHHAQLYVKLDAETMLITGSFIYHP